MGKSLEKWREEYEYYSSKASEINRSLALGGIGIIWIFKNTDEVTKTATLDRDFILPLTLLGLSLFFDLLHYFTGSQIWYVFFLQKEKKINGEEQNDIDAPYWMGFLVSLFFYIKIVLMLLSYLILLKILFVRLF